MNPYLAPLPSQPTFPTSPRPIFSSRRDPQSSKNTLESNTLEEHVFPPVPVPSPRLTPAYTPQDGLHLELLDLRAHVWGVEQDLQKMVKTGEWGVLSWLLGDSKDDMTPRSRGTVTSQYYNTTTYRNTVAPAERRSWIQQYLARRIPSLTAWCDLDQIRLTVADSIRI